MNVDLQGVIQYAFSESVDHFNAVHHVATLAAERKIREQRAVTSPNLSYAVTSPNLNDSHHESFQTLDSVPSRTTASSVSYTSPSFKPRFDTSDHSPLNLARTSNIENSEGLTLTIRALPPVATSPMPTLISLASRIACPWFPDPWPPIWWFSKHLATQVLVSISR